MKELSPELKQQILKEAEAYCKIEAYGSREDCSYCVQDFRVGAEMYALKWQNAEEIINKMKTALVDIYINGFDNKSSALVDEAVGLLNNYKSTINANRTTN